MKENKMLFKEAKEFLNSKGYILEDFEIKKEYNGPRGSAVVTINGKKITADDFPKGTRDSNWRNLGNAIATFKSYYPKWQKYVDMDVAELANYMSDFWHLTHELENCQGRINYFLKNAKIDASAGNSVIETYRSKSDEVEKYNKDLVENETNAKLEERNGKVSDHEIVFPNFERAITLNVDWVNGTFYKWTGLCAFIDLSDIDGLTANRNTWTRGQYDLTAENLNKIEKWLNDNEEFVRKEMKRGSDYFDDVAEDQARYYKDHPNGNWSGD
jgi:hypothetical protein